jgi:hypothetical protein
MDGLPFYSEGSGHFSGRSFSKMAKVTLIHPQQRVGVSHQLLVRKSDLFAGDLTLTNSPYTLKSRVSLADFQEFVAALEGKPVTIKNDNFRGLSQLCQEFRFEDLATQLSQFRESGNFTEDAVLLSALKKRILAMEEEMANGKRETASLRCALSRVQESLEQRIRTEAESASRRADEVEQRVGEVRSKVETVREALREVREVAEGAQKKAASTEAPSIVRFASVATCPASAVALPPSGWNSAIVPDFPKLFEDFMKKQFTLLWRGSRDGFGARDFHGRCDRHPNTLTVILDTNGNIFGGFTPVEWESPSKLCNKIDPSEKSFLFTLKNPHNVPARRFALRVG